LRPMLLEGRCRVNGRPPSYLELEMTTLPVVHNEGDFAAYGTRGVPQNVRKGPRHAGGDDVVRLR